MGAWRGMAVAALLAAGAGVGCSGVGPRVFVADGFAAPGTPYGDTLAARTQSAELYQGVDTMAKGWATWLAPDLLRARAEAAIRAYGAQGETAETLRQEAEAAIRGGAEFHLALYTPKKQWNDVELPESLWRVHLETVAGQRLAPISVAVKPKTDRSAVEYPYVSPWTREYSIAFPQVPGASAPALVLTGPLGTLRFAF